MVDAVAGVDVFEDIMETKRAYNQCFGEGMDAKMKTYDITHASTLRTR